MDQLLLGEIFEVIEEEAPSSGSGPPRWLRGFVDAKALARSTPSRRI
jgi:hypothetical protein